MVLEGITPTCGFEISTEIHAVLQDQYRKWVRIAVLVIVWTERLNNRVRGKEGRRRRQVKMDDIIVRSYKI